MNEKELIAGYRSLKIKQILRTGSSNFVNANSVAQLMELSENEAVKLLNQLEELGYLTRLENINAWANTMKSEFFLFHRLTRVMDMADAEKKVNDIIEKIKEVNASNKYLYKVTLAIVIGDFLNKELTGIEKLEIGIRLERKYENSDEFNKLVFAMAKASGKSFPNVGDEHAYVKNKVPHHLKDSRHNVLVYYIDDISDVDDKPAAVIFEATPH